VHQIRIGDLQRFPRPLAGLRGPFILLREEGREEWGKGREGERKRREETPPFANSWIRPYRRLSASVALAGYENAISC